MENLFKKWYIDKFHATSPCGKYEVWIANGFAFFEDQRDPFVDTLGVFERYIIWREFKQERKRRAIEAITRMRKS